MGFEQDVSPIDNRFGPLDLSSEVDCCVLLNILLIKSPSREMVDWLDPKMAMAYLLGPISLALSGLYDISNYQWTTERQLGDRTHGRVRHPVG